MTLVTIIYTFFAKAPLHLNIRRKTSSPTTQLYQLQATTSSAKHSTTSFNKFICTRTSNFEAAGTCDIRRCLVTFYTSIKPSSAHRHHLQLLFISYSLLLDSFHDTSCTLSCYVLLLLFVSSIDILIHRLLFHISFYRYYILILSSIISLSDKHLNTFHR